MTNKILLSALPNIPLIKKGDNLVNIILKGLGELQLKLRKNDILVIAQKIISKAEGREVFLSEVRISNEAKKLATVVNKPASLVELILRESQEIIRYTPGSKKEGKTGILIVRHKLGYISANAGIDHSNISQQKDNPSVLLLPEDSDKSAMKIRKGLIRATGSNVGIIINDSHGRAWREGTVGVTLGVAGIDPVANLIGKPDMFKQKLQITKVGIADEISSAASLLMGQANEKLPIIHVNGVKILTTKRKGVKHILREPQNDLFL